MSKLALQGNNFDDDMPQLTLRDMLIPLFRHRRVVIISFSSIFVLSTLAAWLWAAHYYKAAMQVVVEQDRSDPAITAAQSGSSGRVESPTSSGGHRASYCRSY